MYTCEICGAEYETLSALRMDHQPCPVAEDQRRHDEAVERLADERGLEVGDRCRVIESGEEALVFDVEAAADGDGDPTVVWVPAGSENDPDRRRTDGFDEVV